MDTDFFNRQDARGAKKLSAAKEHKESKRDFIPVFVVFFCGLSFRAISGGSCFNFGVTPFVRLWLWISAFASLAGWGLSAAGELNRAGYAAAFGAFAVFIFLSEGFGICVGQNFFAWLEISPPVPAAAAALFWRAGGFDFSWRVDSRAGQLYRAGVSRRAGAAMVVARALVLD